MLTPAAVHAVKANLCAGRRLAVNSHELQQTRLKASVSSGRWLRRQKDDMHTREAKINNYRSRAAYKLMELDDKFLLFKRSTRRIVDLGFAPGAWTQVAMQRMARFGHNPSILGVDIIQCSPPGGAHFLLGDIFSKKTHREIQEFYESNEVDMVISDMMANTSGIKANDHYASMELCAGALMLASNLLRKDGSLVMKFYTGAEDGQLERRCREMFGRVNRMKPAACRAELREMYMVCRNRRSGPHDAAV